MPNTRRSARNIVRRTMLHAWVVGFSAMICGCGRNDVPRVEVSGTVTLDGQPLERGAILFVPVDGTPGPKAAAAIIDGHFHLDASQGPPEGQLLVRITNDHPPEYLGPYDPSGEGPNAGGRQPQIPARYNTASTLRVETRKETENSFHFELRTAP